jgi:aryl-alcohol dehydrogenase-like predicted oxidoreductase
MTRDMTFPANDWRSLYFTPENLAETLDRVERVKADVPAGMTLPELALRFILEHPAVSTTIPGMRKPPHVAENTAVSDGRALGEGLMAALRAHRWDRTHVIP